MKVLLAVPWGHVFMRNGRVKDENDKVTFSSYPVFKGSPEKHALALIKRNGGENALVIVDKVASTDTYWTLVRRRIVNLNKKAKANG